MRKFELIILWIAVMFAIVLSVDDAEANPVRTTSVADICSTKTSTVRNVSERTKKAVYKRDGVPSGNHTGICGGIHGCEVDHRIALTLGGSNSIENLMIQPYDGPCSATHKRQA